MKIFDEKGRLFGVFNIVDLCIVVFVVAVCAGGYVFLKNNIANASPTKTYNVTLEIKKVEESVCENIIPGKTVFDRIQNQQFGTLEDARVSPAVEYTISEQTGEEKKVLIPNRYDVELDLVLTTDEEIFVGKKLSVSTKDFMGAGYIIKMEKEDN